MLFADAVMRADQPGLQVAEERVGDGQVLDRVLAFALDNVAL